MPLGPWLPCETSSQTSELGRRLGNCVEGIGCASSNWMDMSDELEDVKHDLKRHQLFLEWTTKAIDYF